MSPVIFFNFFYYKVVELVGGGSVFNGPTPSSLYVFYCISDGLQYIVSVLGRDEGYTVKYSPSPEGTPEGEWLYLTIYSRVDSC